MPRGISIRINSFRVPIFRLHYSSHPERGEAWVASEKPKYSAAMWAQEQEIDYGASGGERILRELLERRWKEIVITDPKWEPDPKWSYWAGMDYGKTHPAPMVFFAMGFDGTRYALCEDYRSDMTPAELMPARKTILLPCIEDGIRPLALSKIQTAFYDPSMGYSNIGQEEGWTSYIELFMAAGFPQDKLMEGLRGKWLDKRVADEIRDSWNRKEVGFKIVCRNMPFPVDPGSMKKREGIYESGCPNLLWELLNLRRKEHSPAREETVGASEALVQKDNDAFDCLCYWWTAMRQAPEVSVDEKWRNEVERLRTKNPQIDFTTLAWKQKLFEQKNRREEMVAWK